MAETPKKSGENEGEKGLPHEITRRLEQVFTVKGFESRTALGAELEKRYGLAPTGFNRFWNVQAPPTTPYLLAVKDLFRDVDMNWLLVGTGSMIVNQSLTTTQPMEESPYERWLRLDEKVGTRIEAIEDALTRLKSEMKQMQTLITENQHHARDGGNTQRLPKGDA